MLGSMGIALSIVGILAASTISEKRLRRKLYFLGFIAIAGNLYFIIN